MLFRKASIFILMLLVSHVTLAGGGWTHARGRGYFKLSQWWTIGNQHFTDDGTIDPNPTLGTFNTSLYGEYGLTNRLNVQLYFPFFSRSFHNSQESGTTGEQTILGRAINSVGDTDIGLKYALISGKPIVLSTHFWLGLPLGSDDYDPEIHAIALATGDGEFNQMIGLTTSTAKSFGKVNVYTSLGFEFNNRTGGFSDETRVNFEIGAVINDKFILGYKLLWINSLHNGDTLLDNGAGLFSNNIEYVAFTYELAYNISDKVGAVINLGGVYTGKLISATPSFSVGVYYNL